MANKKTVIIFAIICQICLFWVLIRLLKEELPEDDKTVYVLSRAFMGSFCIFIIGLLLYVTLIKLREQSDEINVGDFLQEKIEKVKNIQIAFLLLVFLNCVYNIAMQSYRRMNIHFLRNDEPNKWVLGLTIYLSSQIFFSLSQISIKVIMSLQGWINQILKYFLMLTAIQIMIQLFLTNDNGEIVEEYRVVERFYFVQIFTEFFKNTQIKTFSLFFKFAYLVKLFYDLIQTLQSQFFEINPFKDSLKDIYFFLFLTVSIQLIHLVYSFFRGFNRFTQQNNQNLQSQAARYENQMLSDSIIQKLNKYIYSKDRAKMENWIETECSICIESFQADQEIIVSDCNHLFHANCIQEWLKVQNSCPNCRKQFTQVEKPLPNNEPQLPQDRMQQVPDQNLIIQQQAVIAVAIEDIEHQINQEPPNNLINPSNIRQNQLGVRQI